MEDGAEIDLQAGELLLMAACALIGCAVYFTAAALTDLPEGRLLRQLAGRLGKAG